MIAKPTECLHEYIFTATDDETFLESVVTLYKRNYCQQNEKLIAGVYYIYLKNNTKTCLSNTCRLTIDYEPLNRITHNFTIDTMWVNCGKIKEVFFLKEVKIFKHVEHYFPHAKFFWLLSMY